MNEGAEVPSGTGEHPVPGTNHVKARAEQVVTHAMQEHYAKEHQMGKDEVEVTNIFKPGHGEGAGGGAPWAAILPALMANKHDGMGFGGGGFGAGLVGGLLGGALFGGRRGGLLGGDSGSGDGGAETRIESDIFNTAVLTKLGSIESSIPLASAQTENVILQQTNAITNLASQNSLATQAGFNSTKDAVTNVGTILLQSGNQNTQQIIAAISNLSSKIDSNTIAQLQAELAEVRMGRTTDAVRVDVNQNVNQAQAQAQQQQQLQSLVNTMSQLCGHINQLAVATNSNMIIGSTGVATGAQTANPVNVR